MTPLPVVHRVARSLARSGFRGASHYWRIAERLVPIRSGTWSLDDIELPVDPIEFISSSIYRGVYERADVQVFQRLLGEGDVAVDVGANIGYYTRLYSRWVGARGRVIAVEPSPVCLPMLENLPPNVDLFACAVGDREATAELTNVRNPAHFGQSTLCDISPTWGSVPVSVRRLDDVLDEAGVEHVDLLKVDVEGYEPQVLTGAARLIGDRRFRHAVLEVTPAWGDMAFLGPLLDGLGDEYVTHRIAESGSLRRRPILLPLSRDVDQYNLLVSRVDSLDSLLPLIR